MSESITVDVVLFLAAAMVIAFAGTKLAAIADQLADVTGWGEATVGALILGGKYVFVGDCHVHCRGGGWTSRFSR